MVEKNTSDQEEPGALAALRLSRSTDESTSIDRQTAVVTDWSQRTDGEPLVGEALDIDVSGSVSPFDRPDLGKWLADVPPKPWRGLVAWKLDRISRNALDTLQLLEWLEKRGKYLVAVSDGIDTRLPMGRLFVQLAAIFAELERTFIRERILSSRAALREQGRYGGEGVPYGLQSTPREDGPGRQLVPDPVAVSAIRSADRMIRKEGKKLGEVIRWFEETGVLPPRDRQRQIRGKDLKGDQWHTTSLARALRSRSLVEHDIVSPSEFLLLQAALDKLSRAKERGGNNPSPLSGVALCWECLDPLWHRAQYMPAGKNGQKTEKTYRYYYCKAGHTRQMPADEVETLCLKSFLLAFSGVEVTERVEVPPTNHDDQIAAAQMAVEDLSKALASARSDTARTAIQKELTSWDTVLADLEAIPSDPGGVRWVPTGRTWDQQMEGLDAQGRRELWKRVEFGFAVQSDKQGLTVAFRPAEGSNLADAIGQGYSGVGTKVR